MSCICVNNTVTPNAKNLYSNASERLSLKLKICLYTEPDLLFKKFTFFIEHVSYSLYHTVYIFDHNICFPEMWE